MRLEQLEVSNLRILESVSIAVHADLVLLTGANGSGKSSLLEAIHLLGTGRSFRSRTIQDVLRRGSDRLLVRGRLRAADGSSRSLGVERLRQGDTRLRCDGEEVRTASVLARELPLLVIGPDSQRLLSDGAEARRRLVDWLLFHVEPDYQAAHVRYRRALRQRNAMLRVGSGGAERDAWCEEMGRAGVRLEALRRERLDDALPALERALSRLSALAVGLEYRPGWDRSRALETVLREGWERDVQRGFSGDGPHRADLAIRIQGRPAQHVVSRGEGKALVFAVLLGFAELLVERLARRPLVLVDELASELDADNRARVSSALRDLELQTFVTAVSESLVGDAGWARIARFHVERGTVAEVLQ